MDQAFEKWCPHQDLDTMYDVDDVRIGPNGYSFVLVPDGRRSRELEGQRIILTWDSVVAYQVSQERYREELWIFHPEQAWSFWKSGTSAYLEAFRTTSSLLPENAVHWMLVGTHMIADIIAEELPKITMLAPRKETSGAHRKEIELQGCVEIPMEMSQEEFCQRFLDFVEGNRWSFGGGMQTIVDGYYLNEDGTPGQPVWPEEET